MRKILDLVAMSVGGSVGWAIGSRFSLFAAFLISVVGTGVGLYAAIRVRRSLLP